MSELHPVTIKLEGTAGTKLEDAIAGAIHVATVNTCWAEIDINGVTLLANPTDSVPSLLRNWKIAMHRGAKFVSGNVVPFGPGGKGGYPEDVFHG